MFVSKIIDEVILMAVRALNITVDPKVYEDFCRIAEKKGIRTSPWVTAKMKEFIEQEKAAEKHS